MFLNNKYTQWYYRIIDKARANTNDGTYCERHHIIPRSIGGDNSETNLVRLPAREHFICHKLLVRMTTGIARRKMSFAMLMFTRKNTNHQRIIVNARDYAEIRRLVGIATRDLMTGKIISAETRARMSASKKVTHNTPEARARMSAFQRARPQYVKDKIGAAHKGKIISAQHRTAISQKLRGSGNGRALTWMVYYEDGRTPVAVISIKTWCADHNFKFPSMYRTLKTQEYFEGMKLVRT